MTVTIDGTTGITTPGVTNSGAETIATTLAVTGATTLTGNVTLGSSLLATPSGSAPSYTCRAWVNFNGTGTVAIRASGNVTSITDNGVGDYTVNFATAMPDANYSATCTVGSGNQFSAGAAERITINAAPTASAFRFGTAATSGIVDALYANVSVFR